MELFKDKKECCGCTACENICPKKAISMQVDEEGFLYPNIDSNLCIECGLCKKVCSFNENYIKGDFKNNPKVYAAIHKNEQERITSRSGGVFIAISDWILKNKGIIYGAGYDKDFKVCHKRVTNKKDLAQLKGSKYVQSNIEGIFSMVKLDLKEGKYVLFSGTSCQIAGLRNFLGSLEKSDKLYTCDIICHGVPSPLIWKEYLNFIKSRYNVDIEAVDFRDKSFGWGSHLESFYVNKNGKKDKITTRLYVDLFYQSLIIRPSCFNCYFTNLQRPSDNKGTSLILINTKKGKQLFENSLDNLIVKESNIKDAMQHNLRNPTPYNPKRKQFWDDYCKKDFKYVLKKYTEFGIRFKLKKKINHYIQAIKKTMQKYVNKEKSYEDRFSL